MSNEGPHSCRAVNTIRRFIRSDFYQCLLDAISDAVAHAVAEVGPSVMDACVK